MQELAVTSMTVAAALSVGLVMALLAQFKLNLSRRPDRSALPMRWLFSGFNAALVLLVLLCGCLVDWLGSRTLLIAGSVLLTLAFLALGAQLSRRAAILTLLFCALGSAMLHVGTIVQLPRGLFGLHEVGASLQLGMIFFALGALLGPPLFDLLSSALGFTRSVSLLSLLFLVPGFLSAIPDTDRFAPPGAVSGLVDMLLDPAFLAAGMVFIAYAPLEAFVGVWTSTYLGNIGEEDRQSVWLGWFWSAMLLSRFLFAILLHSVQLQDAYLGWLLVIPSAAAAVVLGNISSATHHKNALVGLVAVGALLGPVFPILLAMLFKSPVSQGLTGCSYGFLFAVGSLGSLTLAPLVHLGTRSNNIQAALRIPLFLALALTVA